MDAQTESESGEETAESVGVFLAQKWGGLGPPARHLRNE